MKIFFKMSFGVFGRGGVFLLCLLLLLGDGCVGKEKGYLFKDCLLDRGCLWFYKVILYF